MTSKPTDGIQRLSRTLAALLGLLTALLVLPLIPAPRADALSALGRANLDGTGADASFIGGAAAEAGFDVAVDARHVYWTRGDAIGRADLDGSRADPSFISGLPAPAAGLAVDADHIYWSWGTCDPYPATDCSGAIARANLDGSGLDLDFIGGVGYPNWPAPGLAVDAGHIYWTTGGGASTPEIARANLEGSGVDREFITTLVQGGLAIDAQHLYWTGRYSDDPAYGGPSIGRAHLDGSGVEERFIVGPASWHGGVLWNDVAVDGTHLYWTGYGAYEFAGTVGRANLDGTGPDPGFITDAVGIYPGGLAVDASYIYWTHDDTETAGRAIAPRAQRQRGKRIVVKVKVEAKERLSVKATGKTEVNPVYKLKPQTVEVQAHKTKTLKLKPRRAEAAEKIAAALKRGEKAKATVTVKLTDLAGNSKTEKLRVRLRR